MAVDLTVQNFDEEVLKAKEPVVVDFFAEWCGPCQMAKPVIEELATEYKDKVKIGKMDVDASPQTAQKYGVMSIPTVIAFVGGQEVKRQVGFPGKEAYKQIINELLKR